MRNHHRFYQGALLFVIMILLCVTGCESLDSGGQALSQWIRDFARQGLAAFLF